MGRFFENLAVAVMTTFLLVAPGKESVFSLLRKHNFQIFSVGLEFHYNSSKSCYYLGVLLVIPMKMVNCKGLKAPSLAGRVGERGIGFDVLITRSLCLLSPLP